MPGLSLLRKWCVEPPWTFYAPVNAVCGGRKEWLWEGVRKGVGANEGV